MTLGHRHVADRELYIAAAVCILVHHHKPKACDEQQHDGRVGCDVRLSVERQFDNKIHMEVLASLADQSYATSHVPSWSLFGNVTAIAVAGRRLDWERCSGVTRGHHRPLLFTSAAAVPSSKHEDIHFSQPK